MYSRALLPLLSRGRKSVLVLGPRQVGKSTLVRSLGPEVSIDLADEEQFLAHASDPGLLRQRIAGRRPATVFVDEVQRLPRMLNTIQSILDGEKRPPRFLLTGSSARKLRRGRANVLPGRIHAHQLGPLTVGEIGEDFDEERALGSGTLPGIYAEPDRTERLRTLRSYASVYVREEIQAEALTRNVEGFARFLRAAAAESGKLVDQVRLAKEAAVTRTTVQRYYEVLEDTLLAYRIDAYAKSERRRLIQHPRYFFFDVGVFNALVGSFEVSADRIGTLLEHFVVGQIVAIAHAADAEVRLSSYRTEHGAEVDLVLEHGRETWAIEVKAARRVGRADTTGLASFAELFGRRHRKVILHRGAERGALDDIEVWPYREFLAALPRELA